MNESPKEQLILACGPLARSPLDDASQYPDERPVTHRLLAVPSSVWWSGGRTPCPAGPKRGMKEILLLK